MEKKIVLPAGIISKPKTTRSQLKQAERAVWDEIMPAIASAVEASFAAGKRGEMLQITGTELKERTEYAHKIAKILRYDLKWSKTRIKDHIEVILRSKLSGIELDLDSLGRRTVW